jgi:hypothetical protein
MTLPADEFIRRFLLHVLPDGLQRIRYYGFLGNRHRKEKLELCRRLLGMPASAEPTGPTVSTYAIRSLPNLARLQRAATADSWGMT